MRSELAKRIYKVATRLRKNDTLCAEICAQIENKKAPYEIGCLCTGWPLQRVISHESEAWARARDLRHAGRTVSEASQYLYAACPWLHILAIGLDLDRAASFVFDLRRTFVSTGSLHQISLPFGPGRSTHVLPSSPRIGGPLSESGSSAGDSL